MVVVAAVLLLVAVVLGVLLVRTRARVDRLTSALVEAVRAREDAEDASRAADDERTAAQRARDDALEREKRAKREAADVARRLREEHAARAAAEEASACLEAELAEVRAVAARPEEDADALWRLALASVRRTWDVSVAPSPGVPSPLDGAVDELRAAIEIEVDAAREEAGAAIDLEWNGDAVHAPAVSVRALSIAQELVARVAKATEAAVLRVTSSDDALVLEIEGTDAEGRSVVPLDVAAEHREAPGRYVLAAGPAAATAGRRGR